MTNSSKQGRYIRQMLLPNWGEAVQQRLASASVFVAGLGGLGSPAAFYLAAAGVGRLILCDADEIQLHNLNRQILYQDTWIGQPKAMHASQVLGAFNPNILIEAHQALLTAENVERIVGTPDVIIDCLDNFETRYLLNTYGLQRHIPLVHAGLWGLIAQITFLHPPETPCLRCLVPQAPEKQPFPAVGALCGMVGSAQAAEALKYLGAFGSLLKGRLLIIDAEDMSFNEMNFKRNPDCPDCGPFQVQSGNS